jgi:hypothetical protein
MLKAFFISLAFILPSFTGLSVVAALDRKGLIGWLERAPLSFTLGAGLLSIYMLIIGALGMKFSFLTLLPFFLAGAFTLIISRKRPLPTRKTIAKGKALFVIPLSLLLAWKLFFILFSTLAYPTYFDDALTTWDYKAKTLYYAAGLGNMGSAEFLGGGALNYPLGTSLFKTWIALMAGVWSDACIHLYHFAIFVSMLILFYVNLRQYASASIALLFTYALSSIPLLAPHTYGGYADTALGYYLFAAVAMLARWFHGKESAHLVIGAVLAGIMAFIKNEGLVLFMPVVLATFLGFLLLSGLPKREKTRLAVYLAGGVFLTAAPWLIIKKIYGLGIGPIPFEFHPSSVVELLRIFFWEEGAFGILWAAAAAAILSNWATLRDRRFVSYFAPTLVCFLAVAAVFTFTSSFEWLWERTTINRTLLTVTPLVVFTTGLAATLSLSKKEAPE